MQIDSNIPIPALPTGHSRKPKWAPMLKPLKVGDSFFVELPSDRVQRNLYGIAKRLGIRITARAVVENGKSGTRVWRVAE